MSYPAPVNALTFQPRIPLALRLVNQLGTGLRRAGLDIGGFDVDGLVARAVRVAGADDLDEMATWREALEVYATSLEKDANLNFLGRIHLRDMIVRALADRIRLRSRVAALPALERPPLVVCGLPRSGTTFLHRLLAAAEDTRALPLWELMEPIAPAGKDGRLARAHRRMTRIRALMPHDLDAIHLMRAELPDECSFLLKTAFRSAMLWQGPAIGWLEWHLGRRADAAYADWHDWLRLLQVPGRRFVLKDPFHVAHLPELFAAVPNAMVVRTHRDPLETLPSYHKLTLNMHAVMCDRLDVARIVEANTRWQVHLSEATLAPPPGRTFDVDYRELVADPVGTVRAIHTHFGLGFDEALATRLSAFVQQNSQRKHGDNPYASTDFGQTDAGLARRFADYREAWRLDRAAS